LASGWGFPTLWVGELPKIWGLVFNIYAMAKTSDFKNGTPLGFAKAYKKIPPRIINGCGPGLEKLPKFVDQPSWYRILEI